MFYNNILTRPQTTNSWEESKTQGIDIILALDISEDEVKDLKPNRLEISKEITIDFIKQKKTTELV